MHEIGVREVVHFAGLTFNWETLCMTWLTMAIVILISWLATRNLKMIPTGWQNVVEILVSWLSVITNRLRCFVQQQSWQNSTIRHLQSDIKDILLKYVY